MRHAPSGQMGQGSEEEQEYLRWSPLCGFILGSNISPTLGLPALEEVVIHTAMNTHMHGSNSPPIHVFSNFNVPERVTH